MCNDCIDMCISVVCCGSIKKKCVYNGVTHSSLCCDSFVCVYNGVTHSSVCCDSFVCVYQVCVVTHLYVYIKA